MEPSAGARCLLSCVGLLMKCTVLIYELVQLAMRVQLGISVEDTDATMDDRLGQCQVICFTSCSVALVLSSKGKLMRRV